MNLYYAWQEKYSTWSKQANKRRLLIGLLNLADFLVRGVNAVLGKLFIDVLSKIMISMVFAAVFSIITGYVLSYPGGIETMIARYLVSMCPIGASCAFGQVYASFGMAVVILLCLTGGILSALSAGIRDYGSDETIEHIDAQTSYIIDAIATLEHTIDEYIVPTEEKIIRKAITIPDTDKVLIVGCASLLLAVGYFIGYFIGSIL